MSESKRLFQPTLENPFYRIALDADYSQADNSEQLKKSFGGYLERLITLSSETLAPIESISQTAEVFYFSTLSAALLQLKAELRKAQLAKAATPEESLLANLRIQFFGGAEKVSDSPETHAGLLTRKEIDNLLNGGTGIAMDGRTISAMSNDFVYTGKAMRALTAVSVLNNCSLRNAKEDFKAAQALRQYVPTDLIIGHASADFPVIGAFRVEIYRMETEYSPKHMQRFRLDEGTGNGFGNIFSKKLEEILSAEAMDDTDRARTEELRDFYLEFLTGMFFQLNSINLPRVFSLSSVVCGCADETGWVTEDTLNRIVPSECSALLSNESVLARDYGDMNMTRYRVSNRINAFSQLTKRFNLLSPRKQSLLNNVVEKIQGQTER